MIIKLKENFLKFLSLHFIFLLLLISIRFFEQLVFNFYKSPNFNPIEFIGYQLNFDALFVIICSVFLLIPFLLITLWKPRAAIIFLRTILFILLILHLALTQFFLTSGFLLDDTVFYFSAGEIKHIIGSEAGSFHWYSWIMMLLIPVIAIWLLLIKKSWVVTNKIVQIACYIVFPVIAFIAIKNMAIITPSQNRFDNFLEYQFSNNKVLYFVHSYLLDSENKKKYSNLNPETVNKATINYHNSHPWFKFSSNDYPLMHNEPYENPLGAYFPESKTKPNIVIIICESLSASFCGDEAYKGHFTPFLDSLIDKSLYWNNFLSNAEHTYGALPNVLASLPFGAERGFINNMNGVYPFHQSIITLLNKNDYQTRFFYGGWGGFDHTQDFIKYNQVDYLLTDSKFNKTKYKKQSKGGKEEPWGYNDKDLFNQAFDIMNDDKSKKPYLNIYLTLTMHSPYNMATTEYSKDYLKKYLDKSNLSKEQKAELMTYSDGVTSALFTDDAFRDFFETYKKRSDFNNTIFIITGDHNMYLFPLKNQLETYHVPLIIYSPMLKKPNRFPAASFHADITPSLIGLLEQNFKLTFPSEKHWLGRGLDTAREFRIRNEMPLSLFSANYYTYIGKGYLLVNNELYSVDNDLNLKPENNNEAIKKEFLNKLNDFSIINLFVCANNKIFPKF